MAKMSKRKASSVFAFGPNLCHELWTILGEGEQRLCVNSEGANGQEVWVKWKSSSKSDKTATYFLTPTDPQATAQPIFNFHCMGDCYNCWQPKSQNGTPNRYYP